MLSEAAADSVQRSQTMTQVFVYATNLECVIALFDTVHGLPEAAGDGCMKGWCLEDPGGILT